MELMALTPAAPAFLAALATLEMLVDLKGLSHGIGYADFNGICSEVLHFGSQIGQLRRGMAGYAGDDDTSGALGNFHLPLPPFDLDVAVQPDVLGTAAVISNSGTNIDDGIADDGFGDHRTGPGFQRPLDGKTVPAPGTSR